MKKTDRLLWLVVAAVTAIPGDLAVRGQGLATVQPAQSAPAEIHVVSLTSPDQPNRSNDPTFNLAFAGGTVRKFVDAVSQAVKKPLNVILNPELADTAIPPMELRQVTVPRLFNAVKAASEKTISLEAPNPGVPGRGFRGGLGPDRFQYSHGFRTTDEVPSTDSVWVFYREDPPAPLPPAPPAKRELPMAPLPPPPVPVEVRVLNLTSILEGRSIDDVTTALRTACDMLEGAAPPKLTFHKETNLLMLRGTQSQLDVMDRVLKELAAAPASGSRAPTATLQMSPELMQRYGLTPPAPSPAAPRRTRTPDPAPSPESAPKKP